MTDRRKKRLKRALRRDVKEYKNEGRFITFPVHDNPEICQKTNNKSNTSIAWREHKQKGRTLI
jgi:hypothetical protein